MRALLHPAHRPVVPGVEPALEVEPGRVGGIGAREAARGEAQPRRLRPYCFLKAFVLIHGAPTTPRDLSGCFSRNFSASTGSARSSDEDSRSKRSISSRISATRARSTGSASRSPTGSIYGLLGPNGAGKTTTLRMLLGIIDPSSGTRRVLGRERPLDAAPEIGYLPEERGLYPAMTAREAIAFMGALRGLPLARRPPPRR